MFYVGQKVVCINTPVPRLGMAGYGNEIYPQKGEVYTVRAVPIIPNFAGGAATPSIRVYEIINPMRRYKNRGAFEPAFPSKCFRPLDERKTDIAIFKRLLVPTGKELVE